MNKGGGGVNKKVGDRQWRHVLAWGPGTRKHVPATIDSPPPPPGRASGSSSPSRDSMPFPALLRVCVHAPSSCRFSPRSVDRSPKFTRSPKYIEFALAGFTASNACAGQPASPETRRPACVSPTHATYLRSTSFSLLLLGDGTKMIHASLIFKVQLLTCY